MPSIKERRDFLTSEINRLEEERGADSYSEYLRILTLNDYKTELHMLEDLEGRR